MDDAEIKHALRYVIAKPNRNGTVRWYWQRKGHKTQKLDSDLVKRIAQARSFNAIADQNEVVPEGSVRWAIERYKLSSKYTDLSPTTLRIYNRWLKQFDDWWSLRHVRHISRRIVMELRDDQPSASTAMHAIAVLYNVLEVAREYEFVEVNQAARPNITKPKPRKTIWRQDEINKFLTECDEPGVWLAFMLLLYTAQRPIDVVKMNWNQYDGDLIELTQQKTDKLVAVPCHRNLRAVLAEWPREGAVMCVTPSGRSYSRKRLWQRYTAIAIRCELQHLMLRDLRRTAMVNLGAAGATEREIASVSGHSIESTRRILETYLPTNIEFARNAIRKWERYEDQKSDASD